MIFPARCVIAKKKQGWSLVPETKNKPNAQGTLFRAPVTARKPESRQPRGYSPERYAEVRSTLSGRVTHHAGGESHFVEDSQTMDHLTRSLATSTVPTERIASVNGWATGLQFHDGRLAEHDTFQDRSVIRMAPGVHRNAFAVTHELGHEESFRNNRNSRAYSTSSEQGAEEGSADRYANQHARLPGYKKRPDKLETSYERTSKEDPFSDFSQSYLKVRDSEAHKAMFGDGDPSHFQGKLFSVTNGGRIGRYYTNMKATYGE